MAGELDQTAPPLHAHKFTAAMQAAQGCAQPILLKTMRGAGHNQGSTPAQIADSYTDELSFLARVLKLSLPGM
jgi:prolyl oligopeptidase